MGYVAVKGGEKAILNSEELLVAKTFGHESEPIEVHQILEQFALAVDRVMGEGGLYWPKLAAYALKQALGDSFEAAFLVRAFRSSVPRRGYTDPIDTRKMRVHRRISAAFKDVPGGQILGATPDYGLRFIRFDLFENLHQARIRAKKALENLARAGIPIPDSFPKIVDILREQGLLVSPPSAPRILTDITMETVSIPTSRSARLQFLARGETGGASRFGIFEHEGLWPNPPGYRRAQGWRCPCLLGGKALGMDSSNRMRSHKPDGERRGPR